MNGGDMGQITSLLPRVGLVSAWKHPDQQDEGDDCRQDFSLCAIFVRSVFQRNSS